MQNTEERITGIPNTLPPQTYNGMLEFGRVGSCARADGRRTRVQLPASGCKTGIYNTLQGAWSMKTGRRWPAGEGEKAFNREGRRKKPAWLFDRVRLLLYCIASRAASGVLFGAMGTFFSIAFRKDAAYTRRAILG